MDLNLVVSGLTKMLQRLLGEDIALITELQPDLPCVKIDPGQIEQVIVNLAVNARHAMPDGRTPDHPDHRRRDHRGDRSAARQPSPPAPTCC